MLFLSSYHEEGFQVITAAVELCSDQQEQKGCIKDESCNLIIFIIDQFIDYFIQKQMHS